EAFNHRFWRVVEPGVVKLPAITVPDASVTVAMALIDGSDSFVVGSPTDEAAPLHIRRVASFYLDPTEVSLDEWKKEDRPINPELIKAATPDTYAVSYVVWDRAVAYAESVGKRLPDEFEYE